jgi:septum formation protein
MLVLASQSPIRLQLLVAAGVAVTAARSGVDEHAFQSTSGALDAKSLATKLSQAKAIAVSALRPDDIVIGCDQTAECDGKLLLKANSIAEARHHLKNLRGTTHTLHSAVCLAQNGESIWSMTESAHLSMRVFSNVFLETYLQAAGDALCNSVGCYHLEGLGLQLFEKVEGDYFAILGLPLLPLLAKLRELGELPV